MHPDFYKRPLLLALILLILGLLFFYKPVPGPQDVSTFLPQKEVVLSGRVERFYTPKPTSNNVIVKVHTVNGQPAQGYVYARLANFEPLWKDTLEVSGKLQEPYGIDLLGNFNWRKYLSYKHVFAEIKSDTVRVTKPAAWPWRALRAVRGDILRVLNENFPHELSQIASGILLGERGELSAQLLSAFQDSGAIHLLVASGGNVGFVTLLTLGLCGWAGLNRRRALWVALLVAGFYTLMAGADAPLLRAYFMAFCAFAGYYLGRNSGVLQGLVLSCMIILLVQPSSLFETGFQMSFLATFALIVALANYPIPLTWPRWVRFFAQIFLVTLAVQLVLLPVFTNVFYKVSLAGLIANMLLVPLASFLLGLTFIYYVFSWFNLAFILHYPTLICLQGFKYLVELFASLPFAAWQVTAWGAGTIAAYYVGLFALLHAPLKKWRRGLLIGTSVSILGILGMQYWLTPAVRIYLLDEWYHNIALVQVKHGPVFIVGNGLSAPKAKQALYKIGCRQADGVLLTDGNSAKNDYTSLAKQVIAPFQTTWPGETVGLFGNTRVRMQWGLHQTKQGRIWYNTGYSGSKYDEVSYCFDVPRQTGICVGRLVYVQDRVITAQTNQTVKVKL